MIYRFSVSIIFFCAATIILATILSDIRDARFQTILWKAVKVAAWIGVAALILAGVSRW